METELDFTVVIPRHEARYPDHVAACVPRGMREKLRRAAAMQGITPPDFIRRVLEKSVTEVLDKSREEPRR